MKVMGTFLFSVIEILHLGAGATTERERVETHIFCVHIYTQLAYMKNGVCHKIVEPRSVNGYIAMSITQFNVVATILQGERLIIKRNSNGVRLSSHAICYDIYMKRIIAQGKIISIGMGIASVLYIVRRKVPLALQMPLVEYVMSYIVIDPVCIDDWRMSKKNCWSRMITHGMSRFWVACAIEGNGGQVHGSSGCFLEEPVNSGLDTSIIPFSLIRTGMGSKCV